MQIVVKQATREEKEIIQNLARFYVYEMYRYCGALPGWEIPSNGLFECYDLSRYWDNPNHYPFLVTINNEIAGFALVNKKGSSPEVDWNIGEFFITSKFQNKGIGRKVAYEIFDQFPGTWEVMQMPANRGAIEFWKKVVNSYSRGFFETSEKIIQEPKPHPMIVLKFQSPSQSRDEQFTLDYQEISADEDEAVLLRGITEEAFKAKGLGKVRNFSFFMKDAHNNVLAGVKGASYYGCLYVDLLWVAHAFRHKGWGTQLMQEAEKLGKNRQCRFVSLTTMDWEALPFYQKLGYQIEYVREGYEKDSKMYVLRKELVPS